MRLIVFLIMSAIIASACLSSYQETTEGPTGSLPKRAPRPPERIDSELQSTIARIAENAGGKVGVGAVMLETGDAAYLDRQGHFAMQSVYKLPIAMAVAKMIDDNKVRIDADVNITPDDFVRRGYHSPIRNMNPNGTVMPLAVVIRYSISESDGTANDVLLELAGGPANVQQYLGSIGIDGVTVADSTKTISRDWETQYRNWATPEGSVKLLTLLFDRRAGLSELTTGLLLDAMTATDTGRHRIRRGLPEGAVLAHKTGTGGRPSEVPGYKASENGNLNAITAADKRSAPGNKTVAKKGKEPGQRTVSRSNSKSPAKKTDRTRFPTNAEIGGELGDDESHEVTSATNDVGIITLPHGRHIILAVYIQDSTADGPTREKVIADIARVVCERWTTGQLPLVEFPKTTGG